MSASCAQCANLVITPKELEDILPGLNIVSSAYGSVRADTAYCKSRDVFMVPTIACPEFKLREP